MRTRFVLALPVLGLGLSACASGPHGVNTGNRMPWTGDCGVSVADPPVVSARDRSLRALRLRFVSS